MKSKLLFLGTLFLCFLALTISGCKKLNNSEDSVLPIDIGENGGGGSGTTNFYDGNIEDWAVYDTFLSNGKVKYTDVGNTTVNFWLRVRRSNANNYVSFKFKLVAFFPNEDPRTNGTDLTNEVLITEANFPTTGLSFSYDGSFTINKNIINGKKIAIIYQVQPNPWYIYSKQYETNEILTQVENPYTNAKPLYRFVNAGGRHMYTTIESEKSFLMLQGWTLEGALGFLYTNQEPGTVAIYRHFKSEGGLWDHYLTTSSNIAGYASEGIMGWAYPTSGTNLRPMYCYYKPWFEHFFSGTPELGTGPETSNGYAYEGITCYMLRGY